ncbi:sorting nexin-19 [Antennarius striatus]|uniref:sorting nexin-19 n=1 Tax=Antennarius striatus TaxID=241820 RepID=UPI0035AF184A
MIATAQPKGVRPKRDTTRAMAEVLGQKSLMGFGVILAWLVLFHLLVNIWLLCVFTSLLVVLGGWLGSQAILESDSVVHLERFISLEQVPPTLEDEQHLDQEIHNTVRKIIRDFVTSWYSTVSSESAFEKEVQEAMISMAMELKIRARHVDRKELTKKILDLLGCHLQDYIRAKEQMPPSANTREGNRLWKAYSGLTTPHIAMASDEMEVTHTRAVVDLLLHVLVPSPHLETRTGRLVVGELITCNVFLPLIAKLSDPDWLNGFLVEILGTSRKPKEPITTVPLISFTASTPSPGHPELAPSQEASSKFPQRNTVSPRAEMEMTPDPDAATPELAYDVVDSDDVDYPQNHVDEEPSRPFLKNYMRGSKSNPFYRENDSDLDSPLADYKRSSMDSLVMIGQEDGLYGQNRECATPENSNGMYFEDVCSSPADGSCPKVLVYSHAVRHPGGCDRLLVQTADRNVNDFQNLDREGSSPLLNPVRELLLGVEQSGLGSPSDPGEDSPLQSSCSLPSFNFEPLSSPDGPAIIQNLRITGTITAKEHRGTGSHPYTLYTIKYETAMGCETPGGIQPGSEDSESLLSGCETPSTIQPVAYHTVNRRYSEFLNLQTRLEEKTDLRKLIKGVKGPKKIFPDMPFGNMDSDKIEARKGLLETFLKQLCMISEIANSEEMQEFLALNTDARIAFVKKPFIVSRIDKIVVNAIVDTLKTAFPRSEPQSPTDDNEVEVDGKMYSDKKSRARLKFSSRNILFMNGSDVRPPVLFSWEQSTTVFRGMSLGDLETFITEHEKLSITTEAERENRPAVRTPGGCLDHSLTGKHGQESASEMALAEVTLNILCLLMKKQWSWICTENIQRTIRLLFGTLINRWLNVSIANMMCTRYWVVYLQVIQEAVWPGGTLPTTPCPKRSEEEKDSTKQQALCCLMRILPDLVSDMLGSEKHKLSCQTALDSFQDPFINRHLVYCLLDLLLDSLVPEISDKDFQRSLLQTLSKNSEKLPA